MQEVQVKACKRSQVYKWQWILDWNEEQSQIEGK